MEQAVPSYDFGGRVVLVTGGASGIGLAAARRFAASNARVMIADLNDDGGGAAARAIREAGGEGDHVRCDVADEAGIAAAVGGAVDRYGALDIAFNNAGILGIGGADTGSFDSRVWDQTVAINLSGVFYAMKHELAHMVAHGGGVIVNTSSTAGLAAAAAGPAYAASKHGVLGLTRTAAKQYLGRGVRINAVCPGAVATSMMAALTGVEVLPTAPGDGAGYAVATPAQIAEAVVWLCSSGAAFVHGQALVVDGGLLL